METNEELEIVNAIEVAVRFAKDVARDSHMWRWVVIALHQALQGIMVRALMDGTSYPVYSEATQKKWLAWSKGESGYPPKERLAEFPVLYDRVKQDGTGLCGHNRPFIPSRDDDESIILLNDIRNEFIHFTPKGWSLDEKMFPKICRSSAKLLAFEGWESENITWYEPRCQEAIRGSCRDFIEIMAHMGQHYGVRIV